jgi:hypothetical protein
VSYDNSSEMGIEETKSIRSNVVHYSLKRITTVAVETLWKDSILRVLYAAPLCIKLVHFVNNIFVLQVKRHVEIEGKNC